MNIRRSTKFNTSVSRALHGASESSSENGYSLRFGENEGLTQTNNQLLFMETETPFLEGNVYPGVHNSENSFRIFGILLSLVKNIA
ncbi:hypothetical protein CEXT_479691 [Caerostris extrusa]|uniref:Uncharacterized protein n=1 Tax=Caerostris extrusa TaxID=172846 RepID=A0AAV4NZ63_CAEEX|nr:hypothetical protein CEXT_479691 [Caerostris extrusa]